MVQHPSSYISILIILFSVNPYFPPNYDGYFPNQFPGGGPSADFSTRDQLFSGTVKIIIKNFFLPVKVSICTIKSFKMFF